MGLFFKSSRLAKPIPDGPANPHFKAQQQWLIKSVEGVKNVSECRTPGEKCESAAECNDGNKFNECPLKTVDCHTDSASVFDENHPDSSRRINSRDSNASSGRFQISDKVSHHSLIPHTTFRLDGSSPITDDKKRPTALLHSLNRGNEFLWDVWLDACNFDRSLIMPPRIPEIYENSLQEFCNCWKLPIDWWQDLLKISLFDIIILVDDTADALTHKDDIVAIITFVCDASLAACKRGITLRWLCSKTTSLVKDTAEIPALVNNLKFESAANVAEAMKTKILEPNVASSIFSDGAVERPLLVLSLLATDCSGVEQTISRCIERHNVVAFSIVLLEELRPALQLYSKDTPVDVTLKYEAEEALLNEKAVTLTPSMYLVKVLLGAIDPNYRN